MTAPKLDKRHHRVTITFKAAGTASGFQCALVKLPKHGKTPKPKYSSCRSPKTYSKLSRGSYRFDVRAFNKSGRDPTAATTRFSL